MKTKVYVEKAVQQWRSMFSCGEDTTVDEKNVADPIKNEPSKQNNKSNDPSGWLRQMTNKLAEFGNIERMDTDSTTGSQSEEATATEPVSKSIRPATAVPAVIKTTEKRPSTPKSRPLSPKKRHDSEQDKSEQDIALTTTKTQQDKANDYGPSTKTAASQSIANHDAYSISVLTMKEFDEDGNFTPDVIRKDYDYNAHKMAQMVKGIDIKSSIARVRHYKKNQAEQQQRREENEARREQEELLQKRLQQRRREKERKEQEKKLQKQLELQKKRDEAKQQMFQSSTKSQSSVSFNDSVDKWENEFPLYENDHSLIYSVSASSSPSAGILKRRRYLAPPSRMPCSLAMEEEEEDHLSNLRLILESPSDEQDVPSDEDDEPQPRTALPVQIEPSKMGDGWEIFEGGHVFHMDLGKKHFSKWGHYKASGFKWEERPWTIDL